MGAMGYPVVDQAVRHRQQHRADEQPDEAERERINKSAIHVDFMIGSNEMDVDGITRDGDRVPVLRGGAWQI